MSRTIAGVTVADSGLACEMIEFVRDTEPDLLFHHSGRVYLFGALLGEKRGLRFDPELLLAGAMFHDLGLTGKYRESLLRFEVDGANAARDFLRERGVPESSVEIVWDAIALHTTPGIPEHKKPEVALVNAGVEMDVLGRAYDELSDEERKAVLAAHPRGAEFKLGIIGAFYEGMKHRPESTFGTMNDDILAYNDPTFRRRDFCQMILSSSWPS